MPAPSQPADDATVVYTDGSCRGNPGPGGWAWAVEGGPSDSGGEAHTTNQRMEVMAVIRALSALTGPVHMVSDSTYVVNCFRNAVVGGLEAPGLEEHPGQAGGQPGPLAGAAAPWPSTRTARSPSPG